MLLCSVPTESYTQTETKLSPPLFERTKRNSQVVTVVHHFLLSNFSFKPLVAILIMVIILFMIFDITEQKNDIFKVCFLQF